MKKVLFIGSLALSGVAIYLILKRNDVKKSACGVGISLKEGQGQKELYPDAAREEYDTSWKALHPSSVTAIGSTALNPDNGTWK